MSTYMLWIILSAVLRSPILAGVVILVGGFFLDQAVVGILPSPLRTWRRFSRVRRLEHTLLQNPNDRRSRFELAEFYVEQRRFQKAVDVLKPNLEAGDDDPHTLFVMGVACLGAGHVQQGETFLDAAEAQDPNFRMGSIELERGRFRMRRKDYKGAVEALSRFQGKRDTSVEGTVLLAQALELSGDDAQAALKRQHAWRQYVTAPSFQRRRERRWAWRAKPSRPLLYATAVLLLGVVFFRFAYPKIRAEAMDVRQSQSSSQSRHAAQQQQQDEDDD